MFNIKVFQPAFLTLYYTISILPCTLCSILNSFIVVFQRYIILLASIFYMGIVSAVCVFIAENARRKKGVLSEDIAAILLCTALYLHPKSSHALYVHSTVPALKK